jgi:hypothetical protein
VKQLELGAPGLVKDDERAKTKDVRGFLVTEVAMMLVPRLDSKGTSAEIRETAKWLGVRIIDLVERRLRDLPACDVCLDDREICATCGLRSSDHAGEHDFVAVPCDGCPFPGSSK